MFHFKCRIKQIRNNKRWQLTTVNTGRVLSSHKQWSKAVNAMIMEQKRQVSFYGQSAPK